MKKHQQLGLNPSTASGRLVKDLLFKFVSDSGYKCFRCGGSLTRETFSIEHKEPWLDSDNPSKLFFDLDNIAYSHKLCNIIAARRPTKTWTTEEERRDRRAQIERRRWERLSTEEQQAIRRGKYVRNGC